MPTHATPLSLDWNAKVAKTTPMPQRRFLLTPNRSFSWAATAVLFGLLGLWVLAIGIFSLTHKTWPILGFAGLELAGLAVAFLAHSHKSRMFEEVVLTTETVHWTRHLPSGAVQRWQAPLAWTQLETDAPTNTRSPLVFSYAGNSLEFGTFLNPEDRGSFFEEFKAAKSDLMSPRAKRSFT